MRKGEEGEAGCLNRDQGLILGYVHLKNSDIFNYLLYARNYVCFI